MGRPRNAARLRRTISLRLSEDTIAAIDAAAARMRVTRTQWIELAALALLREGE